MKLQYLLVITMIVSSLFSITMFSVEAADVTISDGTGDVTSIDYLTGETNVILDHPDIDVDNLDLIQATYAKQELQAIVSLSVKGNIENRGKLIDPLDDDFFTDFDTVEYEFLLSTSEQNYSITYSNNSGMLSYGAEQVNLTSSDFSVVGNTFTIPFTLTSANETYSDLSLSSTYIKFVYDEEEPFIELLSDVAPNPPLAVYEAYAPDIGSIGENIQFNASVEPLTGTPPYTYHWDFGDGDSSTLQNPAHSYTKAGVYTYTFTVTDDADTTESLSGNITISGEGGGNDDDNQMILLLAIILIIIVIGVVVIVWIIRRR
jgi:hypothetical protein